MHLALVIRNDVIEGWIDGELMKSAMVDKFVARPETCDYDSGVFNAFDSTSNYTVNNTILHIGGYLQGKSMVGMIQDFMVFRNLALTKTEIAALMSARPARKYPTLDRLLAASGIRSWEGHCKCSLAYIYIAS